MDPNFWGSRMADKAFLGVMIGLLYHGIADDITLENFTNVFCAVAAWSGFGGIGSTIYVPDLHKGMSCFLVQMRTSFYLESKLFRREINDGLYVPIAYYISNLLVELVVITIGSVVLSVPLFYVIQLHGSLLVFILTLYASLICSYGKLPLCVQFWQGV